MVWGGKQITQKEPAIGLGPSRFGRFLTQGKAKFLVVKSEPKKKRKNKTACQHVEGSREDPPKNSKDQVRGGQ